MGLGDLRIVIGASSSECSWDEWSGLRVGWIRVLSALSSGKQCYRSLAEPGGPGRIEEYQRQVKETEREI